MIYYSDVGKVIYFGAPKFENKITALASGFYRESTHFSQTSSPVVAEFPDASPYRGWWLNYYITGVYIMSSVNYSLKHKGVRLISADKAFIEKLDQAEGEK